MVVKYTYPSGNNGTFQLVLDVDDPDEVDKEYDRMVNQGATPIFAPKTYPWGLRSCYIADPEGKQPFAEAHIAVLLS